MLRQAYLSLAVVLLAGPAAAASPSPGSTATASPSPGSTATAILKDADGQTVGTFRVRDEGNGKAEVSITTANLPPGFHGLHVHGKGVCDAASTDPATGGHFSSAGSHFGEGAHPDHRGDLPNLLVGEDGTGTATYITDRFGMDQLTTETGTSIMIHEKPDNHANIPDRYKAADKPGPDADTLKAGDSGNRIACGVIEKG